MMLKVWSIDSLHVAMMVLAEYSPKVCHQSLVGSDTSTVSQIGRFLVHLWFVKLHVSWSVRSPLVSFVSVMDESLVRRW